MQTIKKSSLKNRLAKSLTTAVTGVLLLSTVAVAEPLDKVIAIVNDDVILASDFADTIQRARNNINRQSAAQPSEQALQSQVIESMILDSILLQIADRQGIKITDRQLNATITKIAENNGMSLEKFREALIAQGQDYIGTREQIRRDLRIKQVQQTNINQRIQISDREIENFLRSKTGKSNAEVLISDIQIAIAPPVTPANIQKAKTQAEKVYQQLRNGANFADIAISHSSASNALNGGDMGWRRIAELPNSFAAAISPLKAGEFSTPTRTPSGFHILLLRESRNGAQAQMIQQNKVRHILVSPSEIISPAKAKRTINQLYQQLIKKTANFADLAREFSSDPGSRSQGGELGWTENGQMVPEFEQVMNNAKVGEISLPFESRFGWHILEVLDRKSVDVSNKLEKNQARNAIGKRKFEEERDAWLREIRSDAYVEFK